MLICGIDEAGRGPLAGPVVASCAVFEHGTRRIRGVKDSKKLKAEDRQELSEKIKQRCLAYAIFEICNSEIDQINILKATMRAMYRCITQLQIKPDLYLIDGNYFKLEDGHEKNLNYKTIIDGDDKEFAISAASILAKVHRDSIMVKYDAVYPEYNFKQHKGYATEEHIENVKKFGLSDIHRKTFCRKYYEPIPLFVQE
jgi:ribonuclease HII